VPGVPSHHRSPPISSPPASVFRPQGLLMSSSSAREMTTTRQHAAGSLGNGQGLQRGGHAGIWEESGEERTEGVWQRWICQDGRRDILLEHLGNGEMKW
jgi:hypothetical protein